MLSSESEIRATGPVKSGHRPLRDPISASMRPIYLAKGEHWRLADWKSATDGPKAEIDNLGRRSKSWRQQLLSSEIGEIRPIGPVKSGHRPLRDPISAQFGPIYLAKGEHCRLADWKSATDGPLVRFYSEMPPIDGFIRPMAERLSPFRLWWNKLAQNLGQICQASANGRFEASSISLCNKFRQSRTTTTLKGPKSSKSGHFGLKMAPYWGRDWQLSAHRTELSGSSILNLITTRQSWASIRLRRKNVSMWSLHGQLLYKI